MIWLTFFCSLQETLILSVLDMTLNNLMVRLQSYSFGECKIPVAEGISYFCLACNLIQLLGSMHNFTQSGWLTLFSPEYLFEQHKLEQPSNTLFGWTTSFSADVLSRPAYKRKHIRLHLCSREITSGHGQKWWSPSSTLTGCYS